MEIGEKTQEVMPLLPEATAGHKQPRCSILPQPTEVVWDWCSIGLNQQQKAAKND